ITPGLRITGLFLGRALENSSRRGESGFGTILIAKQSGRPTHAVVARDEGFVETVSDAFGGNEGERFFGCAPVSLRPTASQERKGHPSGCFRSLLPDWFQLLAPRGRVASLSKKTEPKHIASEWVVRQNREALFIQAPCFRELTHSAKCKSRFYQHHEVARVQFYRPLEVRLRFLPSGRSAIDRAYVQVDTGFVRQTLLGQFKLFQRLVVVAESVVGIDAFLPVHLSRVRLDLLGLLQGNSRQFAALIGVVRASPIKIEVGFGHQAV